MRQGNSSCISMGGIKDVIEVLFSIYSSLYFDYLRVLSLSNILVSI